MVNFGATGGLRGTVVELIELCEICFKADGVRETEAYLLVTVVFGLSGGIGLFDFTDVMLLLFDNRSKTAFAVRKRDTLLAVLLRPVRCGDEPVDKPLMLVELSLRGLLSLFMLLLLILEVAPTV